MEKLKCGGLKKFTVIKNEDIIKYLSGRLEAFIIIAEIAIAEGRRKEGKKDDNEYLVINADEPYADEVINILKRNGHWG